MTAEEMMEHFRQSMRLRADAKQALVSAGWTAEQADRLEAAADRAVRRWMNEEQPDA